MFSSQPRILHKKRTPKAEQLFSSNMKSYPISLESHSVLSGNPGFRYQRFFAKLPSKQAVWICMGQSFWVICGAMSRNQIYPSKVKLQLHTGHTEKICFFFPGICILRILYFLWLKKCRSQHLFLRPLNKKQTRVSFVVADPPNSWRQFHGAAYTLGVARMWRWHPLCPGCICS